MPALDFVPLTFDNGGVAQVVIENLTKVFHGACGEEIRAVCNISIEVADKEFLVLVGPSGCGKTTTLRLIAGLEEPTSGSISTDGQPMNRVPPRDRDIAMVFQNPALYPQKTVYENMAFGLRLRRCPKQEIDRRVREAAEMLDLTECLDRMPQTLSGGQRQRVAVGRAVVRRPTVFLFDEPLSNLDAPLRSQLRAELARLHKQLSATIIYATHDQIEAMTLGDRIAVIDEGAIQQVGAPMTLYRAPANQFVAGFIGAPSMNFFRGTIEPKDGGLWFRESARNGDVAAKRIVLRLEEKTATSLAAYTGRSVVLGIRPENIAEKAALPGLPAEWEVEAMTERIEAMGADTYAHLSGGSQSFVARLPSTTGLAVNKTLAVKFDMRQAHLFDAETGKVIGSSSDGTNLRAPASLQGCGRELAGGDAGAPRLE
jgi:multiple sugar transport system ATP-binding protein